MVESAVRNGASPAALALFEDATDAALRSGLTKEDLIALLQTKAPVANNGAAVLNYCPTLLGDNLLPDDYPIFTELPEGLITVPDAGRKYGISRRTIQTWIRTGRLELRGRLRGSARGGGYMLVDESDLVLYMNTPRRKGRPPVAHN